MDSNGLNLRALRMLRHCAYCGDADGLCRDHVIPTSYLRERRRYEGDWLVPACVECNSTLGAELIFNVPDRAYWILQVYRRKYARLLRSIPWCEEELAEMGYALRQSIIAQEEARERLLKRIEHLQVTSMQPITYLAQLRPQIDPEDEDVSEFIDEDLRNVKELRADLVAKARQKYRAQETKHGPI